MVERILSGNIDTGNNTPTGAKMRVAVDNPYITKDDYIKSFEAMGLGITTASPQYQNGQLDAVILRASAWVNRHCRRWFDMQTIDEQKTGFQVRPYNPQLVTVVLNNRPYSRINTIFIQVLQWFIQVETGPHSYLQDFYDKGFYKIVPMLSSAGTGVGTPIPAAILDRVPLGVLWTNYTFGYGTPLVGLALGAFGAGSAPNQFQAPEGYRLWAPDQPHILYVNGSPVVDGYKINWPNGIVTFDEGNPGGAVTIDVTTNESIPQDIKEATLLLTSHLIGQAQNNPMGAESLSMQTFSITFGKESKVETRVKEILEPYVDRRPVLIGL